MVQKNFYQDRMVSEESEKMIVLNAFDSEFLVMTLHGRFVRIRMSLASEQSGDFRTVRTPEATQLYFLIIIICLSLFGFDKTLYQLLWCFIRVRSDFVFYDF